MSQDAAQKRPDAYADENTIVRRKLGLTIGAYQGFTITVLACLVATLFLLGADSAAQKDVAAVALVVAMAFLFCTALCWIAMALVLLLPRNFFWELGAFYATIIGAVGLLLTATGTLILSSMYGRDWASRKGRAR